MGCSSSRDISSDPRCICAHKHFSHTSKGACFYKNDHKVDQSYSEKVIDYYDESWHMETEVIEHSMSITGNWTSTAYESRRVLNRIPVYKTIYSTKSYIEKGCKCHKCYLTEQINNINLRNNHDKLKAAYETFLLLDRYSYVKISNKDRNILYGLYMQATKGDNNNNTWRLLLSQEKWLAWKIFQGKNKEIAQNDYICRVNKIKICYLEI